MAILRSLARVPLFTLTVILTFALGTAVVATTFALLWHVVIEALPYSRPEQLVRVYGHYGAEEPKLSSVSPPDFADRRAARSFSGATAWTTSGVNLTDGEPERLIAARVTPGFFDLLGVRNHFIQGGPATSRDTVVLSDRVWRRRFGARRDLIGKAIHLNGSLHTVTGIAPRRFTFPDRDTDVWIPFELTAADLADNQRGSEYIEMVARLRDGVTATQANAEMDVITASVIDRVPSRTQFLRETKWGVDVVPLRDDLVGKHEQVLMILFGAAILVMLLVTANVAGLFVARTIARHKEIAVRKALGAGRRTIALRLASEVGILAVVGTAAGLALARLAIPLIAETGLPRAEEIHVGPAVIGFTLAAIAIVTVIIGTIISAYASRPGSLVATDRSGSAAPHATRLRSILVGAQVAIAVTLLAAGALLIDSYRRLRGVEAGFNPRNVLTFRIALPDTKYPDAPARRRFFDQLQERLDRVPGVARSSAVSHLPLSSDNWTSTFRVEGFPRSEGLPVGNIRVIMPGYTETMNIPLLRGRMFTAADVATTPRVVVIDEQMARKYWPNTDPIGKRMTFSDDPNNPTWREVVGVIGSVNHLSLDSAPEAHLYLPSGQSASIAQLNVVVRTQGDARRVTGDIRAAVRALDPAQPLFALRTMEEVLDRATAQPRLRASIIGVFATIGVLLALLGLYALLSYITVARTREIGLRMALGATPREVVRFVGGWAIRITGFGLVAGIGGAFFMTRSLRAFLFGVVGTELQTVLSVSIAFLLIAMAAAAAPAMRAARVDPAVALRQE